MSVDYSSFSIAELLAERTKVDAQLTMKTGGAAVASVSKKGSKKPSKRTGKPTVYGDFSSKVQKEHAEDIKAFKEANPDIKGAHMKFVGDYKKSHDEEYKAFEAAWKESHPKDALESSAEDASVGDSASVSGGEKKADKPKKTLSPEHLAKLKAGREAAKAKKDAAKAALEEAGKDEAAVVAPPPTPAKKAPKAAKKAVPAAPVAAQAPVVAAPADDEEQEALPCKVGATTYLRYGQKRSDGSVLWASGDLWKNNAGAKGRYVGELQDDGSINCDAEEPNLA
jgi:hypothetical protein